MCVRAQKVEYLQMCKSSKICNVQTDRDRERETDTDRGRETEIQRQRDREIPTDRQRQ